MGNKVGLSLKDLDLVQQGKLVAVRSRVVAALEGCMEDEGR